MKKYLLVAALLMLASCGPSDDTQGLARAANGLESCKQTSHSPSALVECQTPQYAALFTAERLPYQDALTTWKSEQLTIIRDAEQGKIPQSVAVQLIHESGDRFANVMHARREAQQEEEAKGPPALQLLDSAATFTDSVHQISDCTKSKERCQQATATTDYYNCLKAHDEYFCAYLKDKAGL